VAAIEPHSVVGDAPELRGSDFVERGAEDDALSDDESDGLAPTERLPCLVELCGVECAGLRGAFRHVCSVARRDGAVKYDDARGKTRGRRRAGRRGRDGRPPRTMPQGAAGVNCYAATSTLRALLRVETLQNKAATLLHHYSYREREIIFYWGRARGRPPIGSMGA